VTVECDSMSTAQPPVEILFIGKQLPDGGFAAHAEAESIFTEADTLDGLRTNIREAVECYYGDESHPRVVRLRIVREEIFRLDG
jgi:hypothetical protein